MPNQVSLFYRAEGYSVGDITFDILLDEQHSMENDVTSHNVEDGSKITDHIKNRLRTGSVLGAVTNFSIQNPTTFLGFSGISLPNRALTAYDAFKLLWLNRTTLDIVTTLEVYEDVAVTAINPTKVEGAEVIEFSVSFQEIKTVKLQEQAITANVAPKDMSNNTNRQAAPKFSADRQVGR